MQEWSEDKENLAIEAYLPSKNITGDTDNAEPRKMWTSATGKKVASFGEEYICQSFKTRDPN